MMATTIGQLLRTVTEVLEGEPIEISIPNIKSTKWNAQFQAYGIDGRAVLEALKKLTAYTIL